MLESMQIRKHLSSFQIIIIGFASVVLIGALLLMLPISTKERVVAPFNLALFTSISSVCVTGLVMVDTATYWSIFGQVIILILIQIGGLGVISFVSAFVLLVGKKFSLRQRTTFQESIAADKMSGLAKLIKFVFVTTFIVESIGALVMMPVFIIDHGPIGVWMAIFHSVSAFCNAGFDILGSSNNQFQSLTSYSSNPFVCITIMVLIVFGGIGFLTWNDFKINKFKLRNYRMQSKIILLTTSILILVPAIYFFFVDFSNLSLGERILSSLFQSITPRTAGFNSVDLTQMSESSQGLMIVLMLIGGSPGSTAGGMKTTTIAILILNALAVFRKKEDVQAFGRRVDISTISSASTILMMYVVLFLAGGILISEVENLPLKECMFETSSALGTVGLSLGITPKLGIISQIILMILMFLGRVGGLTLIYATLSSKNKNISKFPQERITVG